MSSKEKIRYIKRADLEVSKYDSCIKNAVNSRIYAYAWYLDIVADHWDALVLGDYQVVMPLPWRRKYGIPYVYIPAWIAELGIFFNGNPINDYYEELFENFIEIIKSKFSQIDILLETKLLIKTTKYPIRVSQKLDISKNYSDVKKDYRKGRKSDLSKGKRNNLQIKWNDDSKNLILLHKKNVAIRLEFYKKKDYINLERLLNEFQKRKRGMVVSVYDKHKNIIASSFIIINTDEIIGLVTATDVDFNKIGATTFLYDCIIKKYSNHKSIFDFAGSSVPSISKFFRSFGATDFERIHFVKHHFLYNFFHKYS